MKLNHLDLQVADVQRAVSLFEQFFDFELQSSRTSPAIAILSDRHGFMLVLQRKKDGAEQYPNGFHFGFLVEDEQTVVDTQARWRAAGLDCSDVDHNGRGVVAYCRAEGLLIEVSCRKTSGR